MEKKWKAVIDKIKNSSSDGICNTSHGFNFGDEVLLRYPWLSTSNIKHVFNMGMWRLLVIPGFIAWILAAVLGWHNYAKPVPPFNHKTQGPERKRSMVIDLTGTLGGDVAVCVPIDPTFFTLANSGEFQYVFSLSHAPGCSIGGHPQSGRNVNSLCKRKRSSFMHQDTNFLKPASDNGWPMNSNSDSIFSHTLQ